MMSICMQGGSSVAIGVLKELSGNQWQSVTIRGHRWQSVAIGVLKELDVEVEGRESCEEEHVLRDREAKHELDHERASMQPIEKIPEDARRFERLDVAHLAIDLGRESEAKVLDRLAWCLTVDSPQDPNAIRAREVPAEGGHPKIDTLELPDGVDHFDRAHPLVERRLDRVWKFVDTARLAREHPIALLLPVLQVREQHLRERRRRQARHAMRSEAEADGTQWCRDPHTIRGGGARGVARGARGGARGARSPCRGSSGSGGT